MLSQQLIEYGENASVIRQIFEYAKQRKAQIGAENVFDFSIGNPSVPTPPVVQETLLSLLRDTDPCQLHGYTSSAGDPGVRQALADDLNRRFGAGVRGQDFYLTAGAAAALTIALHALLLPGEEVILFSPYFPEYQVFAQAAGAKTVTVPCRQPDFQPDLAALEQAITPQTKVLLVNSPNNPTGVVLSEAMVKDMSALLQRKQAEYGHSIYLLSDEPYRELVYDVTCPFFSNYYPNTLVSYSFSKSLSLPGERIGYLLVPPQVAEHDRVWAAVCGAGRSLGFVCAPALFQFLLPSCLGQTADLSVYRENRSLLYNALVSLGFTLPKPDGAFYLFVQAPGGDASTFCAKAKEYELLLVPSDSFSYPGYVRLAYCMDTQQIRRSLPAWQQLAKACGLGQN